MSSLKTHPGSSNCLKYAITPNNHRRHTFYLQEMVDCKSRCSLYEGQDRFLRNAIFQTSQPALFTTTGGECKTPVLNKLHDLLYHLFVRQESERFAGEAAITESAISRCQINKTAPVFLFCFKTVLNVFGLQDC